MQLDMIFQDKAETFFQESYKNFINLVKEKGVTFQDFVQSSNCLRELINEITEKNDFLLYDFFNFKPDEMKLKRKIQLEIVSRAKNLFYKELCKEEKRAKHLLEETNIYMSKKITIIPTPKSIWEEKREEYLTHSVRIQTAIQTLFK
jgi:hypothetical protein